MISFLADFLRNLSVNEKSKEQFENIFFSFGKFLFLIKDFKIEVPKETLETLNDFLTSFLPSISSNSKNFCRLIAVKLFKFYFYEYLYNKLSPENLVSIIFIYQLFIVLFLKNSNR